MPLRLHIDPRTGYPVYLQIVEQVQRAVAIGVLKPGEQLPTVKSLAGSLVVSPATVSRALRELEHLGIVESYPGRGAFVSGNGHAAAARSSAYEVVEKSLADVVREARSLGVTAANLQAAFERLRDEWYGAPKAEGEGDDST